MKRALLLAAAIAAVTLGGQVMSSGIDAHAEEDALPNFDRMWDWGKPAETEMKFRELLANSIDQLPEREQLVLSLYYEQELNLKEIGAVLDVSESRVCQIHGQAVMRLRAAAKRW